MKTIKYLVLVFSLGLLMASCGEDPKENGVIDLNFKLRYAGDPVVMLEPYTLPNGLNINFSRVSFYMSDITLAGGNEQALNTVDYINLTNSNLSTSSSLAGYKHRITAQEGEHTILAFLFGVNSVKNSMVPADFGSDNDLSLSQEYWPGWSSYVFVKIEGNIDLDVDGVFEQGMALHIGGDEALSELQISGDLTVVANSTKDVPITIDLYKMLALDTVFDLEANPQIHSLDQADIVLDLSDRFVNAITIE